jgi:hypothetical protein
MKIRFKEVSVFSPFCPSRPLLFTDFSLHQGTTPSPPAKMPQGCAYSRFFHLSSMVGSLFTFFSFLVAGIH